MNRSRISLALALVALAALVLALAALFWSAPRVYADGTPPPAATATERPDYCPDAPAPCAGFEDEYSDDNMPMEFDPDGRPVVCPPYPAVCAVPGYEDGPPYPQNHDIDGNPLPTAPAPTAPATPEDIPPADTGVNPDTGRPYYCPDAPAPCAGFEDEYIDNGKPEATPEPTQAPAPAPGLPRAGV